MWERRCEVGRRQGDARRRRAAAAKPVRSEPGEPDGCVALALCQKGRGETDYAMVSLEKASAKAISPMSFWHSARARNPSG